MLQWFIRFPKFAEITEFNETFAPFRKNSFDCHLKKKQSFKRLSKYLGKSDAAVCACFRVFVL